MTERSRIFAVTADDVVSLTLDGANAFDGKSLLHGVAARCIAVDPHDPDRVYVGTFDSGLYATDDGGVTWREDEDGLGDRRLRSLAVSPRTRNPGSRS
jgi:hypothetical protein